MNYYQFLQQHQAQPSLTEYLRNKIQALPQKPKRAPRIHSSSLLSCIRRGMYYAFNNKELEPTLHDDDQMWMSIAEIVRLTDNEFPLVAEIQRRKSGEPDYKVFSTAVSNIAKDTRVLGHDILPYKEVNPGVKGTPRKYFVPHVYRALWIAEKWFEKRAAKEDSKEETGDD